MIKSYNLKIFANKSKLEKLDALLSFWKQEVNKKINLFWEFDKVKGSFCPTKYALGGRIVRDASIKAWQIVKGAKAFKQIEKPIFKGNEIDLNEFSIIFSNKITKEFDFWIRVTCLENYHRLILPCKKTGILNRAMEKGILRDSAKIIKRKNNYFLMVFVEFKDNKKVNIKKVAIDTGMINPVVTSNGNFYGKDLRDLRIRTKHRKYLEKISPYKQGLNRITKDIISDNPNTDFILEDLKFKGKSKNRSREFRRRNSNWSYKHLGKMLDRHGTLEGFSIFFVNPAYTSQRCPICGNISKLNRNGESFKCIKCNYSNYADIVGAINILGRVNEEHSVPQNSLLKKRLKQH